MSDEAKFKQAIDALNKAREEKGISFNGKLYSQVKDRVEVFRMTFGSEYGIETKLDYREGFERNAVIVAYATVIDGQGIIKASGHAMTFVGMDEVATSSPIEAVETSAIGRALATFGLHGGEFASGQEMNVVQAKGAAAEVKMTGDVREEKSSQRQPVTSQPSVNQYNFNVPDKIGPRTLDAIFQQIDAVESAEELTAYWNAVKHLVSQFDDNVKAEIKGSFADRNKQMKG